MEVTEVTAILGDRDVGEGSNGKYHRMCDGGVNDVRAVLGGPVKARRAIPESFLSRRDRVTLTRPVTHSRTCLEMNRRRRFSGAAHGREER